LVTLPAMLVCALAGFGVWALVIGSLTGWVVRSIATFVFAPWLPGFRVGGERAKEMLDFSLTTLGVSILWAFREQADLLVIGKITDQVTVGLYSVAKDLAMLPTAKISTAVNALSAPMMAELQTNITAMRVALYRAVRLTSAIALPTSAGMALVADDMVRVLLGPKWLPAVTVLRWLCVYAAVRAIDVLLPPVLVARRRQRFLFWYFLVLLIAVPTAAALGALWKGAPGAVVIFTPTYCGLMVIIAKEVLAELRGSFLELWLETWPVLAATAAMAAVLLPLRALVLTGEPESPLIELILLVVGGAVTYTGALFAVGKTVIGEGAEIVGWILHRYPVRR
jgi:O-antigen/teichoic acid export membrane protein